MKKLIMAATLAALTVTSAAMAAPLRDPQPGDLKANANYGFDQKEGGRSAKSRLTGGDVTYVLNIGISSTSTTIPKGTMTTRSTKTTSSAITALRRICRPMPAGPMSRPKRITRPSPMATR